MGVGVVYNLSTSRNPKNLVIGTYAAVTFGYWFYCRYNHRMSEHRMKGIKAAMSQYSYLEGTEKDEEWARRQTERRTGVRNVREDAVKEQEQEQDIRLAK